MKLIYHYPTHITGRVSNVTRFGPGEALMYFVSVYPVWRSGKRARLITARSQDRNLSPGFIIISHRCIKALEQPFTPLAQRKSVQAHNLVVVRSKRTGGTTYRDGAEGARGAHNSEVVGSNPTSGIISIRQLYRRWPSCWKLNAAFVTGVAQGQRARLITARSHDRNVSPVFIITSHRCIKALGQL